MTKAYTPDQLKTLFEAINMAPAWLSKRFVMKNLCGWTDEQIAENARLKQEEELQLQKGNKIGGYR
jgi:hypothetical protein